ncbi:MAG: type VI secretion system baseplate subunit TssE [Pseudomonadales bacterium]
MSESALSARLQPSLLDRLTDDNPGESSEPSNKRTLSATELRRAVVRDLQWLLNTNALSSSTDLSDYPEIMRSTVNYGVPDLSGHMVASFEVDALAKLIREAIINFEPRIDPQALHVTGDLSLDEMGSKALVFTIDAEVYAQPGSMHLMLKTTVDLDSGDVDISETAG